MTQIFNEIFTNTSSELSVPVTLAAMLIALVTGLFTAYTYYKTQDDFSYQRSMALTLLILPAILCMIILFVGSNVARAFSLAGTLSIIRFRSAPGDMRDIGFIFFDIAAGLACGVGLYGYAVLFTFVLCMVIFAFEKANLFDKDKQIRTLRITVPEELNTKNAFTDILNEYTKKFSLSKIKTTDLGSLFEVVYNVTLKSETNEQEFINKLRTRNGNLTIILSEIPHIVK